MPQTTLNSRKLTGEKGKESGDTFFTVTKQLTNTRNLLTLTPPPPRPSPETSIYYLNEIWIKYVLPSQGSHLLSAHSALEVGIQEVTSDMINDKFHVNSSAEAPPLKKITMVTTRNNGD